MYIYYIPCYAEIWYLCYKVYFFTHKVLRSYDEYTVVVEASSPSFLAFGIFSAGVNTVE